MPELELELAERWTEVAPRPDGPDLVAEVDGLIEYVLIQSSSFEFRTIISKL